MAKSMMMIIQVPDNDTQNIRTLRQISSTGTVTNRANRHAWKGYMEFIYERTDNTGPCRCRQFFLDR